MNTMSGALHGGAFAKYVAGYMAGGGEASAWAGGLAKVLGLDIEQHVDTKKFEQLLNGFTADGRDALVRNAGTEHRQAGWDLSFAAPKGWSVLYVNAAPDVQRKMRRELFASVRAAVDVAESTLVYSRRQSGGKVAEPVQILVPLHLHLTSRAEEPHVHVHATVVNLGRRADGTFGTIVSRPLYENQKLLGALFTMELATRSELDLGLPIQRKGESFEIKGVPRELCEAFSSRHREIIEELSNRGLSGPAAEALVWSHTREAKRHTPLPELTKRWDKVCAQHGFGPAEVAEVLKNFPATEVQSEVRNTGEAVGASTRQNEKSAGHRVPSEEPSHRSEVGDRTKPDFRHQNGASTESEEAARASRFWTSVPPEQRQELQKEAIGKANPIERGILERAGVAAEEVKAGLLRRFALSKMSEQPERYADLSFEKLVRPKVDESAFTIDKEKARIEPAWKESEEKPGEDLLRYPSLDKLAEEALYLPEAENMVLAKERAEAFDEALNQTQSTYKLSWREAEALKPIEHLQKIAKGFEQRSPFENPDAWVTAQERVEEYHQSAQNPRNAHLFTSGGAAEHLQHLLTTYDERIDSETNRTHHFKYQKPPEAKPEDVEPPYSRASLSEKMNEVIATALSPIWPSTVVRLPFVMTRVATEAIGSGFYAKDVCDAIRRICPESCCGLPVHEKKLFPNAPKWSPFHEIILPHLPVPLHYPPPKAVDGESVELPGIRFETLRSVPEIFGHAAPSLAVESYSVKPVLHEQLAKQGSKLLNKLADVVEARREARREAAKETVAPEKEDLSEKLKREVREQQEVKPPNIEPPKHQVRL